MPNYQPSTRQAIANVHVGMHVKTIDAGLVQANFTSGAQTELFTVIGRIQVKQLFIELTVAATANATFVEFNFSMTTPVVGPTAMNVTTATIASQAAHTQIRWIGGIVASVAVLTAAPGIADVQPAGTGGGYQIVGGEVAAGTNTIGTIGIAASNATQGATVSATAHLFYSPMSVGAYAVAIPGV